jgi:hypothetical protein
MVTGRDFCRVSVLTMEAIVSSEMLVIIYIANYTASRPKMLLSSFNIFILSTPKMFCKLNFIRLKCIFISHFRCAFPRNLY